MANSKQAEKRGRQTITRTERNSATKTRVKSSRKQLAAAIDAGDKDAAAKKLIEVASTADRAAKTGVLSKNAASRIKSRSTQAVAKLG